LLGQALSASLDTALTGLPAAKIRMLARRYPARAERLAYWLPRSGVLLAELHFLRPLLFLGITVGAAGSSGLHNGTVFAPSPQRIMSFGALMVVALVFFDLFPRLATKPFAVEFTRLSYFPLRTMYLLLWPLIAPVYRASVGLAGIFGVGGTGVGPFWTSDEIDRIVEDAHADALGGPGHELIESLISFSDKVIREIMVPRTEMLALSSTATPEDMRQIVVEGGRTRIPVYYETIDSIMGVLHVKDFVAADLGQMIEESESNENDHGALETLLRPTFYVPEIMKISELLREFQRRKTHMAIVVDEYGGTAGVVTLEDIIEEIVGEIQDEYDIDEKQFRIVGEHKIIADGRVNLDNLEDILDVKFPEDGTYETLAGFIMARLGFLPESGATTKFGNVSFIVKDVGEKRIETVEIECRGVSLETRVERPRKVDDSVEPPSGAFSSDDDKEK